MPVIVEPVEVRSDILVAVINWNMHNANRAKREKSHHDAERYTQNARRLEDILTERRFNASQSH